jgi:hypothetical protein
MILFGLVPLTLWTFGPHWLRPVMAVLALVMLVVAVVLIWRRIATDRVDMENWPSRSEYRWLPGWDVHRYHRALLTWLKVEDWRILSARAVDADRLLLCIHRGRHRLPMLLLRPGVTPSEEEVARLREVQRQDGSYEAVLVSMHASLPDPVLDADGSRILVLNYSALPDLADGLEHGAAEIEASPAVA